MNIKEICYLHIVVGSGAAGLAAALRLARAASQQVAPSGANSPDPAQTPAAGTTPASAQTPAAGTTPAPSVALITDSMSAGTSRNTGSDKQTYYKLSLASPDPDSTRAMAEDIFAGGATDGDLALCEAALSARGFYHLVELGVPFPSTLYGESMGYKTDHDRGRRATSAGPYTSKLMTEALERAVRREDVAVLEGLECVRLLVRDGKIHGVLCVETKPGVATIPGPATNPGAATIPGSAADPVAATAPHPDTSQPLPGESSPYLIIWCGDCILATGGPAGMYRDSVYPASQLGMSGMAFEAGVAGKNLTEWQFGLASLSPRWNVSGTYMQVLPRFVSTDRDGGDEQEFFAEYYDDPGEMLTNIFLKGYQWPFDAAKLFSGSTSSIIDLLVYRETILRGRRVYLDFTRNPSLPVPGKMRPETAEDQAGHAPEAAAKPQESPNRAPSDFPFNLLSAEAYSYLEAAGALFGTPIERLRVMNEPAISFYLDHGVDLAKDRLEIAVCAQHNNGGLAVDSDWQTKIEGLYAIGELAGTHGVTRPGGSALNAGQVGAIRAAEKARGTVLRLFSENSREPRKYGASDDCAKKAGEPSPVAQKRAGEPSPWLEDTRAVLRMEAEDFAELPESATGDRSAAAMWRDAQARMSAAGGMIRSREKIVEALEATETVIRNFPEIAARPEPGQLPLFFRLRDMLISQKVYLSAMLDYIDHGAGSRGSALYTDPTGEQPLRAGQNSAAGPNSRGAAQTAGDFGAAADSENVTAPDPAELFRCRLDNGAHSGVVQEIRLAKVGCEAAWRPVRPIPDIDYFFENQWRTYRERMGL